MDIDYALDRLHRGEGPAPETVPAKPKRPTGRTLVLTALGTVAAALIGMAAILWTMQDRLVYPGSGSHAPARPGWTETTIATKGIGPTSAYWLRAEAGRPTILFLHGNAYGYEGSVAATRAYAKAGFGVFVPEFPGYAGNPGRADEASLDAVADAAMTALAAGGVKAEDIVIYGNSIGTGPAIHAARRPHGRLVIVSGVASVPNVVATRHPWIPAGLVNGRDNAAAIRAVQGRKIVVHATDDDVVPYAQGKALADAAEVPVITLGGGHGIAFNEGLQSALADSLLR